MRWKGNDMQDEARLVAMLDRCREGGWAFTPHKDWTWNVFSPDRIKEEFGLNDQPSRGHHSLVEALSFVAGVEQGLEWVRLKAGNDQ